MGCAILLPVVWNVSLEVVCGRYCAGQISVNIPYIIILHYSTLLYITLHYSTLLYITLHYSTLLCITLHYSTLLILEVSGVMTEKVILAAGLVQSTLWRGLA